MTIIYYAAPRPPVRRASYRVRATSARAKEEIESLCGPQEWRSHRTVVEADRAALEAIHGVTVEAER